VQELGKCTADVVGIVGLGSRQVVDMDRLCSLRLPSFALSLQRNRIEDFFKLWRAYQLDLNLVSEGFV
jgi:hypothetical protein